MIVQLHGTSEPKVVWNDLTKIKTQQNLRLFHVVNHRHLKKRPMIFVTNKSLNEWGKVLHEEDLAAAILDGVLERGRFIRLHGVSGRTRHLKLNEIWPGLRRQTVPNFRKKRARISGTQTFGPAPQDRWSKNVSR